MLTVSIFIALLAFFIVLNCFSAASPVKSRMVTQAIHGAFGMGIGLSDEVGGDPGRNGYADMEQSVATGLRAILPDLGFSASQTASGGAVMAVDISNDDMDTRWPELRGRLGQVVNRGGGRFRLQILALDGAAHAAKLAALAGEIADGEGVNPALLSVGYEDAGRPAVEFRFVPAGSR